MTTAHVAVQPIVCDVVAPGAFDRLSSQERAFVRCMNKRDRTGILKVLDQDARRNGRLHEAPFRIRILQSQLPMQLKMQIFEELRTCSNDKYLAWVRRLLTLPLGMRRAPRYARMSPVEALRDAQERLDATVHGHDAAKMEVLKLVCQTMQGGSMRASYSIGLEGGAGTGKTHFVTNAMSHALDRPMVSVQLGGANDVSYLLGQMYTYEGSKEGRLAAGLIESGVDNPIFFFDEVDKISESERGREVVSTLIHLIDPTANACLRDRYFHGVDLDFSRCIFVFSYNDASRVNPILLDRIKRIRVETPTLEERCTILTRHILPRVTRRLNISSLTLSEEVIQYIVQRGDDRREGMRGCEKDADDVLSNAQVAKVRGTLGGDTIALAQAKEWFRADPDRSSSPPSTMYT